MLTDQDVLLLKLALERELLSTAGYRQVLEIVRRQQATGGVGRALRQVGLAGDRVADLAEKAMAGVQDASGAILARCDLEDALVARALERAKLVDEARLERSKNELKQLARTGELTTLSEVLVKRRWLEVPMAVELRRRARERVATCPKCYQQYIVEPDKAKAGRYRCRTCRIKLEAGKGSHSAVEVARGILPEKPPPPIESSQLVTMSPEQQKSLAEARERGMRREAERLAAARAQQVTSDSHDTVVVPTVPMPLPTSPAATPPPAPAAPTATAPATPPTRRQRADKDTVGEHAVPVTPGGGKATDEESEQPQTARWESVHDFDDKAPVVPANAVASFGEYDILSEVARGGMGIIYKARRKGAQKLLALKVLISGVDATKDQVDRFEREGENARKLRHPNIVRVYDAGRHEGYHYIAMEFVEGDTLETILAKGALEPRRAARVIRDVARAVEFMHKAGIVHRDLKPGNIILNEADAPKLIDFGLAKAIDRRAKLTRSGAAIGTPYYMPPEQVRGENEKVGPPSDVYALGAILFEMIVGDVPFKAENPVELYHKIASSELVLPNALKEGIPDDLTTIVAKSMEKDPAARYPTAEELAADLDRFLKEEPITGKRAGRVRKTMKHAKKRGAFIVVVLLAVALMVALAVVVKLNWKGGNDAAVRTLQEQGRQALLAKKEEEARKLFEAALALAPKDPLVQVDLARTHAAHDREKALAILERAEKDGLRDPEALDAIELRELAADARFKAVAERVKSRR